MSESVLIKNIEFSLPQKLEDLVDYESGRVVSRTFAQNDRVSLTLFAFDKEEEISMHTTSGDAMVHVLDGEGLITIGDDQSVVKAGEVIVMPADIPHALFAEKQFKMLLIVVKRPKAE